MVRLLQKGKRITTIACNLKSMVSDHQYSHPNGLIFKGAPKMIKIDQEASMALFGAKAAIVGGCGSANELGSAWKWLTGYSKKPPKIKSSEFMAITSNKEIYSTFNLVNWIKLEGTSYAIGSGSQYAIGAMSVGKSPVVAVDVATNHDAHTGFGSTEYKL